MFRLMFVADTIVASNGGSNHRNGLGKLHNWMGRGLLPVEHYLLQLCVEAKRFCTVCSLAEGFVVVSFVGRILLIHSSLSLWEVVQKNNVFFVRLTVAFKFDSLILKTHFISLREISKMHLSCPLCLCLYVFMPMQPFCDRTAPSRKRWMARLKRMIF